MTVKPNKIRNKKMTIRKATQQDIDDVERIYAHIHERERRGEMTIGWNANIYPTKQTAMDALSRGDLYVGEDAGMIVASAIINSIQPDAYLHGKWETLAGDEEILVLHTLVVEPSLMKHGYGREFVSFYEELARKEGRTELRLDTNAINAVARRLYPNLGYKEVDIVPCVFNGIPDVHLVLFEKRISLA